MPMLHRVLEKPGKKVVLLGNEAIVRGALESGIGYASTYPGTPASEIGDTFSEIAKQAGVYFEYSTNEKVAVEGAAGAAFSGVKSIVAFKHFGINVASDSIFPLAYYGTRAGMVIVVADDPGCWSSGQNEEDSRNFARIAHMPLLEPSNPLECKEFTKLAFMLSEKFKIPVIIRTTTRVSHASAAVKLGDIIKGNTEGTFIKSKKWRTMPPKMLDVHQELHGTLEKIIKWAAESQINFVVNEPKAGKRGKESAAPKEKIGIIASGVSFCHVMEALEALGLNIPVLKIGMSWPTPKETISSFIKNLESVFVVEELESMLENDVREISKDSNPQLKIHGKDILPTAGELKPEYIETVLKMLTTSHEKTKGQKSKNLTFETYIPCLPTKVGGVKVPPRPPTLCPGCPHRATFWEAKKAAGDDTVFGGDIGCYILGIYPPLETADWIISMGAGEGIAHGVKKVSKQKTIAFVGDGTFFHAGIPALINMVYNKSSPLVIALDNRATAMTGHQPHPGTGLTGMGESTKKLKIEDIAKACGVQNVATVNIWSVGTAIAKMREFLQKNEASLIVADGECRLQFMRRARKQGIKVPVVSINPKICKRCKICVYDFGCPAIHHDVKKNLFYIDPDMCWGCGVCPQVCPHKAISFVTETKEKK